MNSASRRSGSGRRPQRPNRRGPARPQSDTGRKAGCGCLGLIVFLALMGACGAMVGDDASSGSGSGGGTSDRVEATDEPTIEFPDLVGENLDDATAVLRDLDVFGAEAEDVTGLDRSPWVESNWTVCTQSPEAGPVGEDADVVLGVVKNEEDCADRVGDGDFGEPDDDGDRRRHTSGGGSSSDGDGDGDGSASTSGAGGTSSGSGDEGDPDDGTTGSSGSGDWGGGSSGGSRGGKWF